MIEIKLLSIDKSGGAVSKDKMVEATLRDIESTQYELKKSIEQSKQLAAQSDRLIKIHRKQVERGPKS